MTARILLSGVLHRLARKASSNGNAYLMATIREGSGDAVRWWSAFAFRESVVEEIERLSVGDALAVSGTFEAKIYAPGGAEPKVSLSLTVDAVISAHAPKREAKGKRAPEQAHVASVANGGGLDDAIPF